MKILLSGYTGLGNFILKVPLLKTVSNLNSNLEIHVIIGTRYGVSEIVESLPFIKKIHVLSESKTWKEKIAYFSREIYDQKYDAFLLPFDASPFFAVIGSMVSNIPLRVLHFHKKESSWKKRLMKVVLKNFSSLKSVFIPVEPGRHEIDLNYDLFSQVYSEGFKRSYDTSIEDSGDLADLRSYQLLPGSYVVFQVGAANGSKTPKKWPNDRFESLFKQFHQQNPDIQIVTVGDQGDYNEYIKPLESSCSFIHNTAGKTSICELISILKYSKLVVAHDSGIMHLAHALSVPLIALYGPTDHNRTKPLGDNVSILYSKNECFAKMYDFQYSETELNSLYPDGYCMSEIQVSDVLERMERMIRESQRTI